MVSILHAKRGDNLIGDMSIRIIDINITGKTVSVDTILLFIYYSLFFKYRFEIDIHFYTLILWAHSLLQTLNPKKYRTLLFKKMAANLYSFGKVCVSWYKHTEYSMVFA